MKLLKEFGRNPHLDWITLLVITFVTAGILVYTGFTLYNAVINGSIKGTDTSKGASFKELDEKIISSVLERFEAKKEVSDKARAGYAGAPDPSL